MVDFDAFSQHGLLLEFLDRVALNFHSVRSHHGSTSREYFTLEVSPVSKKTLFSL